VPSGFNSTIQYVVGSPTFTISTLNITDRFNVSESLVSLIQSITSAIQKCRVIVKSRVSLYQVRRDSFSIKSCVRDKVKVSCLLHSMKACGGVVVQLRPFLKSVLDEKDLTNSVGTE
jgi:hypothetical protein